MSTLQTESPSPKNTEVVEHQAVSCELKVIQSPATPMLRWSRRPDNALDEVEDLKPPLPAVEEQQLILTISTKLCVIDESPTGYFEQYLKDDDEDDDRVEDASDGCTEESGDTDGSDNDWDDFSDIDNLTPNEQWLKMMVDASGPSSGPRSIPRQAPKDERRSISFGSTGMPSIFQRPRALGYDGTCDEFGQDKRSASAPVKSNLGSLTSSRIAAVSAENVDLDQSQAPTKKRDNMFDLSSEAALKHHEHKLEAVVFALNAVQHPVLEEALKSERDGLVSVIEISKAKIEMKKQDEMKQNTSETVAANPPPTDSADPWNQPANRPSLVSPAPSPPSRKHLLDDEGVDAEVLDQAERVSKRVKLEAERGFKRTQKALGQEAKRKERDAIAALKKFQKDVRKAETERRKIEGKKTAEKRAAGKKGAKAPWKKLGQFEQNRWALRNHLASGGESGESGESQSGGDAGGEQVGGLAEGGGGGAEQTGGKLLK